MKHKLLYISMLCIGMSLNVAKAQESSTAEPVKKVYTTSGGEIIFSWADASQGGDNISTITRFSPFFCLQTQVNMDMNQHIGFYTGFSIRNVGFIADNPGVASTRSKERTYNIGVPVAIKLGKMDGFCLFGGYEFEIPINYKEKVFVNEVKDSKTSDWFSSKTPTFYNTVFAGIQTPFGTQIKFKYYLTNFFNKDYTSNDNGVATKPYEGLDVNVFYVSLSFQILRGSKFAYKK